MAADREAAVRAVAHYLYAHQASKIAPDFDELPPVVQHVMAEAANELVSVVWKAALPVNPDIEVLRMRIEMLASEVGEQRRVGGQEMREALLDLLAEELG